MIDYKSSTSEEVLSKEIFNQISKVSEKQKMHDDIYSSEGRVVRTSATGAVDTSLIPNQDKPKTIKLAFSASMLNA